VRALENGQARLASLMRLLTTDEPERALLERVAHLGLTDVGKTQH
jgi:hypothetical protein